MRVWFPKIHCPVSFTCFFLCKPPPQQHLPTPPPLSNTDLVSAVEVAANKTKALARSELILRSCIRRNKAVDESRKKTVQWMDVAGKSLVNVKEFETSESECTEGDSEYSIGCSSCPII